MTKTIGDFSRDGLAQIVDTSWDSNGTMKVTVREMIGQPIDPNMLARMRRLARSAISHPELTRQSRAGRAYFTEGSYRITFYVSRLER